MFEFKTRHGTLFIRGQDLRRIQDIPEPREGHPACLIAWVEGEKVQEIAVFGTAAETFARLRKTEEDQMRAAERREFAGRGRPR